MNYARLLQALLTDQTMLRVRRKAWPQDKILDINRANYFSVIQDKIIVSGEALLTDWEIVNDKSTL